MASNSDEILRALEALLEEQRKSTAALTQLVQAGKKQEALAAATSPTVGATPLPSAPNAASGDAPGTSKAEKEAERAALKIEAQREKFRTAATNVLTAGVASAANPLVPRSAAELSTGENLLAVIAGFLAGDKGAEAAQNLVRAGINVAGGAQARYVLDNSVSDLQSTLSSLADQGINPSDKDIEALAGAAKARAARRFELLARGAKAIDATQDNALAQQQAQQQAYQQQSLAALQQIARNTSGGGSSGRGN